MKIAADLRRIQMPGIGRYMKNLFQALCAIDQENQYVLFVPPGYQGFESDGGRVRIVPEEAKYYSFHEQFALPRQLSREKVDLLHAAHFVLPWFKTCPRVVTLHDVIYLICKRDLPSFIGRQYYRLQINFSAHTAEEIITDSEFSRMEIAKHLRVSSSKIHVIYLAADPFFTTVDPEQAKSHVAQKFGLSSPFLFTVGLHLERKNHQRVIEAFARLGRHGADLHLVIAGRPTHLTDSLKAKAVHLGLGDRVQFLDSVSDTDLLYLYNAAAALVFPSTYEGFGLPVLEAMACGTPVITSNMTSLPEVAGNAAVLVDPYNVEEISQAMERVLYDTDLRSELISKGFKQQRKFSWERAAEETLGVYRQIVGVGAMCGETA